MIQAERHSGRWNGNILGNIWQIKQFQLGLRENKEIHARLRSEAFKITWNPDGFSNNPSTLSIVILRAVRSSQKFKLLIPLFVYPQGKQNFYLSIQKQDFTGTVKEAVMKDSFYYHRCVWLRYQEQNKNVPEWKVLHPTFFFFLGI